MTNQFVEELKNIGEVEEWYWDGWLHTKMVFFPEPTYYKCYHTRYANGYGASIVKHPGTDGFEDDLWELIVIKWENDDWDINYDTSIKGEGYLTEDDVLELCKRIKSLNENGEEE